MKNSRLRIIYAALFVLILITEVLIALFVKDKFIRPYGGDILVVILICCFVRIFYPKKINLLPLFVFLFAVLVEIAQYFNFVSLLGLGSIKFFRVLLGTAFSFGDLICYAVGCAIFFLCERAAERLNSKSSN